MNTTITSLPADFDFIGGSLCLDFANTVGGLPPDSPSQDRLTDYAALVAWSQQAHLLSEDEAHVLLRRAADLPVEAAASLERARALRQAIYNIFAALALGKRLAASDLDALNVEVALGMAGARIVATPAGFGWEWRTDAGALDRMLAPVARAAATLLTSAELPYVRQCANDLCNWLFVDTTKNHRRQWCRTNGCGNMMRVRKFRERQRDKT